MKGIVGLIPVLVDEIESMKQFYRDTLGFEVIEDLGNYVEFKSEAVRFSLCTCEVMYEATAHDTYRQPRAGQTMNRLSPFVHLTTLTESTGRSQGRELHLSRTLK